MNPYLEQPELWHQVHNRLIIAIADYLTPQIVPQYRVSIEERVYTSTPDTALVGVADVAVSRRNAAELPATATPTLTQPRKVSVPVPEEVTERYLEVISTKNNTLVTVIEILLSPKNKRSGGGREAYEKKREKILGSKTNLVEIDLLRSGKSMPVLGVVYSGYSILISRANKRPEADLYTFGLKNPIPAFPVPLKPGETEPIIDLQKLLNEVYERARFDLAIDYQKPVKPVLSEDDEAWVREIIEELAREGNSQIT